MAFEIDNGNTINTIDIGDISTDSEGEEVIDQTEESTTATRPGDADSGDADDKATDSEEEGTVGEIKDEPDSSEGTTMVICPICLGGGSQHMLRQHMAECMATTL